ncbi:2-acylglycerol O-acyltransferase 2-B-like [Diceros bicornis minor]|uniref:2-acylglycerol O-acyltransferase 2-B-like n=1 Tax=Diceros bicornis minor TaxID=77932 RepID=UPI0026F07B47|nr:2-acylglycerol O-acyltransferase 2-B-like [Diceros bicornis minor]
MSPDLEKVPAHRPLVTAGEGHGGELDASRCLFRFHPGGVLVVGAFHNFCTEATGFSHLFPGLRQQLLMLPCWFHPPLFRNYLMCGGDKGPAPPICCPGLGGGQVAVLALGGPLEALEAKAGGLSLRIRNQGICQVGAGARARSCFPRASLVPVFSFRENELFQQFPNPPGSWVRGAQEELQPLLSVALPLFHGPLGLLLPFRAPIHTVGEPWPLPRPLPGPPSRSSGAQAPARSPRRVAKVPGWGLKSWLPAAHRPRQPAPPGRSWATAPALNSVPDDRGGQEGRKDRARDPSDRPSRLAFRPQWGPQSRCQEATRRWTCCTRSTWRGARGCSKSTRRATAFPPTGTWSLPRRPRGPGPPRAPGGLRVQG